LKKLLLYGSIITSFLSFLVCLFSGDSIGQEYFLVPLYPLLYGVLSLLIWPYMTDPTRSGRVTAGVFLMLQWLRCVLLPMLGTPAGYFTIEFNLSSESSAITAGWLFLYEMFLSFLTVYLILRFSRRNFQPQIQNLSALRGRTFVYVVFVLFALVLYLREGSGMYSFFLLEANAGRVNAADNNINQIISALIGFGLTFAVILLIYFCFKRYCVTGLSRYVYLALVIALLRICLISSSSDGRLAVLYPVGAFMLLLPKLFKRHSRLIIRSIVLFGVIVIGLLTIYKVFHAFTHDSYAEALQSGMEDFGQTDAATQINVYFYGVQNIAKNIFVADKLQLPMGKILEDLLRNTFGVHYLLKDSSQTTVALYNLYIYEGRQASGHLFSSLAYGYTYLGPFLAPFATAFNIFVASLVEKLLRKTKYIDTFYIAALIYVRLVYNIFSNFPASWNNASRNLILGFIIIGGASLLKYKWSASGQTYHKLRST